MDVYEQLCVIVLTLCVSSPWMERLIQCPWKPLHLPALKACSCYGQSLYVALRLIIIYIHTCWALSPSINHHFHLCHLNHTCSLCPLISNPFFGDWLPECVLAIMLYCTWSPPGYRPPLLGMSLIPWQGTSRAFWSISWPAPTTSPLVIIMAHPLGCNPTQTYLTGSKPLQCTYGTLLVNAEGDWAAREGSFF